MTNKTMNYADMLKEWSEATGGDPASIGEWAELREKLITEEYEEVIEALYYFERTGDAKPLAKELSDLVYVCFGTAQRPGVDLDTAFKIVHRGNMEKIHPDGSYRVREDGKILKPEGWKQPDMSPAIGDVEV